MDFWMNLGRPSAIALTVYPLTKLLGLARTSLSVVLGLASTLPVWATVVRITNVSWAEVANRSFHGLVLGILVVGAVLLARLLAAPNELFSLTAMSSTVLIFCAIGIWLSAKWFNTGLSVQAVRALRAVKSS